MIKLTWIAAAAVIAFAAVPAAAQTMTSSPKATTNPSMTNGSMHSTQVTRHTTMTTRHKTMMHPKGKHMAMTSCRRMSHARMMRTPRCHAMASMHRRSTHTTVKVMTPKS